MPRGVAEGVSAKSNPSAFDEEKVSYNWTNAMFSWQRTAYHFQPEKNWMNGRYKKALKSLKNLAQKSRAFLITLIAFSVIGG